MPVTVGTSRSSDRGSSAELGRVDHGITPQTCGACGRLLNRATGRCVCEDWGGNAPQPVATTQPVAAPPTPVTAPVAAPVLQSPPERRPTVTMDRPSGPPIVRPPDDAGPPPRHRDAPVAPPAPAAAAPTPATTAPTPPAPPPSPSAEAPGPAADTGVVGDAVIVNLAGAGRGGRRHLVVCRGQAALVSAKKVNPASAARLTFGQLRAADPSATVVTDHQLLAADVWQCPVGGRITLVRRNQNPIELRWTGRSNAGVDAESALGDAFPGKVDQVAPDTSAWVRYVVPRVVGFVLAVVLVFAGGTMLGKVLGGAPPKEEKAPPTTLAPSEVAVRAALDGSCPAWAPLGSLPRSAMPTQEAMLAAVTAMTPGLVEAASIDSTLGPAEAELAWLGRWATLPAEEANREALARIHYSMRFVTQACAPRG